MLSRKECYTQDGDRAHKNHFRSTEFADVCSLYAWQNAISWQIDEAQTKFCATRSYPVAIWFLRAGLREPTGEQLC